MVLVQVQERALCAVSSNTEGTCSRLGDNRHVTAEAQSKFILDFTNPLRELRISEETSLVNLGFQQFRASPALAKFDKQNTPLELGISVQPLLLFLAARSGKFVQIKKKT